MLDVGKLILLRQEGKTLGEIANHLGVNQTTVHKHLVDYNLCRRSSSKRCKLGWDVEKAVSMKRQGKTWPEINRALGLKPGHSQKYFRKHRSEYPELTGQEIVVGNTIFVLSVRWENLNHDIHIIRRVIFNTTELALVEQELESVDAKVSTIMLRFNLDWTDRKIDTIQIDWVDETVRLITDGIIIFVDDFKEIPCEAGVRLITC